MSKSLQLYTTRLVRSKLHEQRLVHERNKTAALMAANLVAEKPGANPLRIFTITYKWIPTILNVL